MTISAHNVVSLFRAKPQLRDWDNSELAQFFRVEGALRQAGIFVDTQRGVTDEGDPWFVYCRQDNGEVFLHIARFDGCYIAAGPGMNGPLVRKKFNELLDELVRDNPVILQPSANRRPGPELYIHPSTMLIVAVAALFYKSAPVRAEDHGDNPLRQSDTRSATSFGMLSDAYSVALVSAMAIIAVLHHSHTENLVAEESHSEDLALLDGILFNLGNGHDDLPSFEGNIEPTGLIAGAVQNVANVVVAEQQLDAHSDAGGDAALALQSLFGKFADTILAASNAVTETAELAVADRYLVKHENPSARNEATMQEGGDSVIAAHAPTSPAFVIAANASDFKADDAQSVQQVSLATSTTQTAPTEPAVFQVAALSAVPSASDVLSASLLPTISKDAGNSGTDQQAQGSGVTAEPVPVETAAPVFYDIVQAGGMAVLLSSSDSAPVAPPAMVAPVEHIAPVGLVGVADDVHLLAVA